MVKGPKKTGRVQSHLKRNPEAPHTRGWINYRKRKLRPKAGLSSGQGHSLTFERFKALMADYSARSKKDLQPKTLKAAETFSQTVQLKNSGFMDVDAAIKVLERIRPTQSATTLKAKEGYMLTKEIVGDFGRTKGLRVFGFGVGYGQLLFFLKNFMGAKVKGVDLGNYSSGFTKSRKLGVKHDTNASDCSLRKQGKFDVTYSVRVFENDILDHETAIGMLDNMAAMTRKGGKSYHLLGIVGHLPVTQLEIIKRGFKIDKLKKIDNAIFIKLTKVRDN